MMEPYNRKDTMLIYGPTTVVERSFIAFDLDGTIVRPQSGKEIPEGPCDWKWCYDFVPERLRALNQSFEIIVFTNQGFKNWLPEDIVSRFAQISRALGFTPRFFAATAKDKWRKPSPCMFDYFVENFWGQQLNGQAFVGDAAGRVGDFADTDAKFAQNIGLRFFTPEVFWGVREAYDPKETRRYTFVSGFEDMVATPLDIRPPIEFPDTRELVIMIGYPGSGKTTFARNAVPRHYHYVNQDTVNKGRPGTVAQCLREVKSALANTSVIVDNTNVNMETRAKYINIAREHGVPVRCFRMETSLELSQHLARVREILGGPHIPMIAYRKIEEPVPEEGAGVVIVPLYLNLNDYDFRRAFNMVLQ